MLYLSLLLLATTLLFWAFFWFREEKFILKMLPFERTIDKVVFGYTIGLAIPLILFLVGALFKNIGLTIKNFYVSFVGLSFAPLVSFALPGQPETFSAIQAQENPLLTWFVITKGASRIEELVTGFAFVIISGFFIIGILALFNYIFDLKLSNKTYMKTFFWGGIIGSVIFFMAIHGFNNTYVGNPMLFIFAGAFRGIVNFIIYKTKGLAMFFAFGFHDMSNNLALGLKTVIDGIFTPLGMLIVLIDVVIVAGFFIRWKDMLKLFPDVIKLKEDV